MLNTAVVVLVLKQDAKEKGFGGGSAQSARSYLAKTKRVTAEKAQVIATRVMIVLYAAVAVALLILGR